MCNISVAQNSLPTIHSCQCEPFQRSGSVFPMKHAEHTFVFRSLNLQQALSGSLTNYVLHIHLGCMCCAVLFLQILNSQRCTARAQKEGLSSDSMCVSARGTGNSSRWWAAHLSVRVPILMLTDSWETRGSVVTHLHACRHEHGGAWISCEQTKGGSMKHNTVLHC